jgi:hypothetical protein
MERIHCRIEYIADGNPTCNILINGKKEFSFTGNSTFYEFNFETPAGEFTLGIEHFGKDMKKHNNRFIEIKKIFLNDIDIKSMIWKTVQVPKLPSWQNYNDFKWEGNLYLGHNSTISYKFRSPIIDFLFGYHQPSTQTSHGMSSKDNSFIEDMKKYFSSFIKKK